MSQENIELVKRFIGAFNERELETFASMTTPDFEWTTSMMAVEGEVFWGREGIDTYFQRMREVWDDFRTFADDYRDLPDRVVLIGRIVGQGRGSGVPVSAPLAIVFDIRGEDISRMHSYLNLEEAFRATGLEE